MPPREWSHGQGPVRRPLRRALHIGHDLIVSAAPPRTKYLIVPRSRELTEQPALLEFITEKAVDVSRFG
jgi:hypothetical protein